MGQQQSNKNQALLSSGKMPQSGYRVILFSTEYVASSAQNKLNLMTDYIVDKDPRLIDIKELFQSGQNQIEFQVFNVLQYRIRTVKVQIRKVNFSKVQSQNKKQPQNKKQSQKQSQVTQQEQNIDNYTNLTKKPYTLGIKFKYYPKINDTILRVSKIFKNSPLQKIGIKKDEYIVGMVEGDFGSIKQFVQLVKILIEAQMHHITLAVCNQYGHTRLQKLTVSQLVKWKQQYGVGYLGIQLAQGWLNKWQLKKNINHLKTTIQLKQGQKIPHDQVSNNVEIMQKADKMITQAYSKQSLPQKQTVKLPIKTQNDPKIQQKQEVDFFKQSQKITHQDQPQNKSQKQKQGKLNQNQNNRKLFQNDQTSKTSLQDGSMINDQKISQKNESSSLPNLSKPARASQPLPVISSSFADQQTPSSVSSVQSQQIQQKFLQMSQFRQQDTNIIKKTQNILQINYKGILKNQNIDDASTICICKDYSKHCQKCFKEKDQNYYFFNKKTNKIYTIEKAMMFPKKN